MNPKGLSYWKAKSLDLREAVKQFVTAKRFADRKIEQMERRVFSTKLNKELQ